MRAWSLARRDRESGPCTFARSASIHGEAPSRTMRPVHRRCRPDSELIPRVSERDGPCRRSRRFAMLSENMGGWIGGETDHVMVRYADFNLLKFPVKAQAMEKIRDLTCLSHILPTEFHGAVTAKVGVGSTVYVYAGIIAAVLDATEHMRQSIEPGMRADGDHS